MLLINARTWFPLDNHLRYFCLCTFSKVWCSNRDLLNYKSMSIYQYVITYVFIVFYYIAY